MPGPNAVTSEEDAVAAFTAAGYTEVTNVEQHGATWHASATNSAGAPVDVHIDGAGKVHEKGEDKETEGEVPEAPEAPVAQPKE